MLDPGSVIKFDLGPGRGDLPLFVNAIPSIIDLNQAQGLDRQKQAQDLLRIIVQKLPLDKNGDLIFDVDEAQDIHNNAVAMLQRAIGVDVLTTFADVESIDMSNNISTANVDGLEKLIELHRIEFKLRIERDTISISIFLKLLNTITKTFPRCIKSKCKLVTLKCYHRLRLAIHKAQLSIQHTLRTTSYTYQKS